MSNTLEYIRQQLQKSGIDPSNAEEVLKIIQQLSPKDGDDYEQLKLIPPEEDRLKMDQYPKPAPKDPELDKLFQSKDNTSTNSTVNETVSINADSPSDLAELIRIMHLSGAPSAAPVTTATINQPDPHDTGCGCSSCAAKAAGPEKSMGDMIKMMSSEEMALEADQDGGFEDATTEPEEYTTANAGDVSDMIPSGDDLHKEKDSYPPTNGGDNPMRLESIKANLYKALEEKKHKYKK